MKKQKDKKHEFDVRKALTLRVKNGLSYQEIAQQLNAKKGTVYKALSPFVRVIEKSGELDVYQKNKSEILDSVQWTILQEMVNTGKLEKASINNLAYAFSQLDHSSRLEKGQSTENLSIASLSEADIRKYRAIAAQYVRRHIDE